MRDWQRDKYDTYLPLTRTTPTKKRVQEEELGTPVTTKKLKKQSFGHVQMSTQKEALASDIALIVRSNQHCSKCQILNIFSRLTYRIILPEPTLPILSSSKRQDARKPPINSSSESLFPLEASSVQIVSSIISA